MKMIVVKCAVIGLFVAASVPASSSAKPQFLPYEGRNAIHDGQGGEKKTVDGVDFWFNGEPTGSRRATPTLLFQHLAGHPPVGRPPDA